MKLESFVVAPQNYRKPLKVVGVDVTVLASNDVTGGYEITLQEGPEGSGPVLHGHPWDESFFILRGIVELDRDGERLTVHAGTLVHFPAGTPHGYRFGAGGGAMLEISGPGGLATRAFELIANHGVSDFGQLAALLASSGAH